MFIDVCKTRAIAVSIQRLGENLRKKSFPFKFPKNKKYPLRNNFENCTTLTDIVLPKKQKKSRK